MSGTEALTNMINNLIKDKQEEATLDLHSYFADKMKDAITGSSAPAPIDDDAAN
jgi:hypothetical protein